jgi:hypothetical protein
VHHLLEDAGLDPALDLLVDSRPRGQVVRGHAPRSARVHDPAAGVVGLAEIVFRLRRILADQRETRCDELPPVSLDVRWVRFRAMHCHRQEVAGVHNTLSESSTELDRYSPVGTPLTHESSYAGRSLEEMSSE